jgi:hypothetical protein
LAAYVKFQDYAEQVNKAVHNWSSHTFKSALTNSAPSAANTILSDITQITAQNGYSAGGATLDSVTLTESSGTAKVTIADEVFTASGGSFGPFRYIVNYNDSATSPADALVCYFDYGSSITVLDTETFSEDYDATNGLWQFA